MSMSLELQSQTLLTMCYIIAAFNSTQELLYIQKCHLHMVTIMFLIIFLPMERITAPGERYMSVSKSLKRYFVRFQTWNYETPTIQLEHSIKAHLPFCKSQPNSPTTLKRGKDTSKTTSIQIPIIMNIIVLSN